MFQPLTGKSVMACVLLLATALGGSAATYAEDALVLYSGRKKSLVQPIIKQFTKETGIAVEVKYGGTSQLVVTLKEEGDRSPADVFWAQDAGALGAMVQSQLFAPLPAELTADVTDGFANPQGYWLATSGRARVFAYAPQRVTEAEKPKSVFDLTDPKYKGRVGWAPTNASFQAFVTAMRETHGEDKTRQWLEAMKGNDTQVYPKNTAIIQAIAAGEVDLGLPNHYYLLRFKTADKKYPVEQAAFADGDIGNLVNVAGVGVLASSEKQTVAQKFVGFLLSAKAQQFFTSNIFEYPVIDGVIPNARLQTLDRLRAACPQVDLDALEDLDGTLKLLREVGLL